MAGKKYFLLFGFCTAFFIARCQPVQSHGQLSVNGTALVNMNGDTLDLHGMSFGWSCFHPRFYTPGVVKWLPRDWNCNVVRASLGIEPEGGYIENPAAQKKHVTTVVDAAIKAGIYVIIDWHSHSINLSQAKMFFSEMAARYNSYPNIIYEIFNEPDYESWPEVKNYAIEIISEIRKHDSRNVILVGSPRWDQEIMMPANDPILGFENLMYTMHFYAGTHKQWLRDRTDSALNKGLPVFVSECAGMEATGDGPIDAEEWNKFIQWMDRCRLSWVTWSVSDKDETCSVLQKSASSKRKWKLRDLKISGIKTRAFLHRYK